MPKCRNCGNLFPNQVKENGRIWNLTGRKFCPECSPLGENNRRSYVVRTEPGKAFCARCQRIKDRGEFHNRKGGQKPLSYCQSCSEEVKKLKLLEKIDKGVASKGGVCADCGSLFPACVFEFVRDGKPVTLSGVKNMSWERFEVVLRDCEMLCQNCVAMRKWASNNA